LLILCLLVTFKVISQTDTNKYVILTHNQAKKNVKDLIKLDIYKKISTEQDKRIKNLLLNNVIFKEIIVNKDSIISNKDQIIQFKDELINRKKKIEFHGYGGVRTFNIDVAQPIIYFRSQLEFKKINIGAQANYQLIAPNEKSLGFYFNLYVEYKIF